MATSLHQNHTKKHIRTASGIRKRAGTSVLYVRENVKLIPENININISWSQKKTKTIKYYDCRRIPL